MTQQQYNNFEREFGWEDEIAQDSSYVLLEPGEYWFTVTKIERQRHIPNPNSRSKNPLPPCNKAVVTLSILNMEGDKKEITYNLFLHSRTEGMLSAFFGAIGLKKHGEPLKMDWNAVLNSVGVCNVKKAISTNGNEYNDIGFMVYADEVDVTKQLNTRPNLLNQNSYPQNGSNQNYQQPAYQQPQQPNFAQQPQQPQAGYQAGQF